MHHPLMNLNLRPVMDPIDAPAHHQLGFDEDLEATVPQSCLLF
jgi:hypothetical protein